MSDDSRPESINSTPRELREYARGNLPTDHGDVSSVLGLVEDDDLRELLVFAEQAYDRRSDFDAQDFRETRFYQDRVEQAATERLDRAVERGNLSLMQFLVGVPDYKPDISGLHTIRRLETWLTQSERCKIIYVAALMGRGKTDFSLTLMQVVDHYYRRLRESTETTVDVPTPRFATNFGVSTPPSAPDVVELNSYDALNDWSSTTTSDDVLWFIFDEASSELTAQSGANAQDVAEVFAPFVKKMRKRGVNLVVIGHDSGDVHPAIRTLADYVDKGGTKKASFYAGVKNREGTGHLFSVDGIPPTSWDFDTNDTADWSWGSALDEVDDDGLDEQDLKRWAALRAADLWDALDDVSQADAVDLLSDEDVSISRKMLRKAKDGEYGSTVRAD